MKNFNLIEMAKAMKEHKLRHMWRYAAMMALLLTLVCGEMWGDTSYYLFTPTSAPNPSHTGTLSGNFVSPTATSDSRTIDTYTFTHKVNFGSALGTGKFGGSTAGNKSVDYHVKTTSTTFRVYLYNNSTSAAYTLYYATITEGSATVSETSISVAASFSGYKEFTVSSTTNTTVGIYFDNTNIRIMQVIATESGTAHKQAGEAGYTLSFNKGRIALNSSKTITTEGLSIKCENNFTYASSESLTFKKNNPTANYLSFTTPAGGSKIAVTWSGSGQIAYNTSAAAAGATSMTSGTEYTLNGSTTYYVINSSSGSGASITKLEFKAAAAKAYTVTVATSTGTNTYGTVAADDSSLDEDETTTIRATPASGYQVTNWAVSDGDNGASISPNGASNSNTTTLTMGTANATVTATFGSKSYTVTLNNQSATTAGTENVTTTYNSNTNLTSAITKPTKTGYVFAGYFTATNGGGVQLIDPSGNWIASAGGGSTYLDGSKNWKNDGNLTLYACWMEYCPGMDMAAQAISLGSGEHKTWTGLTTNKILYSVAGNTTFDDSDDASNAYDGLKFKNNGDYILFLVQANSSLKLYFGYTDTKPKISINGGAESNVDVSSTGSKTADQEVDFGSETYDRLIKIRTVTSSTVVLQKIEITAVEETCPDAWSFHSKNSSSEWRDPICMELDGDGDFYISEETAINVGDVSYKVGYQGADETKTTETDWQWMPMGPARNWTVGAHPTASNAGGALGYFYIHSTYTDNNRYIGFFPSSYMLRQGSGESWSNTTFNPASSAYGETVWTTPVQKYTASNAADYMYTALGTGNGGAVGCAMSTAMRPIYLKLHSDWKASSPKFYIYYFKNGTDKNGWSGLMQTVSGTGGDDLVGWIPEGDWDRVQFVRFNPGDAVASWEGNVWNSTYAITLDSEKNYYVLEAQGNGGALDWYGHWDLYHNGFYRIWVDNASTNFALHYVPQYVLEYDNNGGSGSIDPQSVALDADPNTVTVKAATGFTAPTGKHFVNWNTAPGGGGTSYDPSDSYSLTADATLYAQWAWNTYDVTPSLTNVSVKTGTTGTGAATHGSAYTVTLQGETGYNLPATVTVTIGGSPATLTTDYTWNSSTGVLTVLAAKVTGNISITVSGVAQEYSITYKDQGDVAFSGTHADGYPTTHTYGSSTTLKTASKTGYTFDGWYGNSACTADPMTSIGATSITANIILYAKWTANSYSVAVTLTDSKATQESGDTGDNAATHGSDYVATFEAVSGYELPSDVIVYIGESQATKDDEYTWSISDGTGTLTINGDEILDDITITVTATSTCSTPADPDGLAAGSISSSGVTFTITDDESPASYDIYYSTSSTAPTGSTEASTTATSKTPTVSGLTASTTYYAWVRSVCDEDNKSDWVALTGSTFTTSAAPATYYLFTPTNASVSMAHTGTWSGVFYTGQSVSNQSGTISTIEYSKGIKFGGQLSSLGYTNAYFLKYDVRSTKSVFTVAATGGSFIVYQVSDGGTSTYTTYDVTSATTNTTFTITSSAIKTIYIGATGGNTNVKILQIKVEESGTIYKRAGEIGYSVSFVDGRLGGANGNDVPLDGMTIHHAQNYTPASSDYIKLSTNNTDYISFTTTAACQLSVTTNASSKAYYVASAKNGTTNETSATGTSTFNLAAGTWYINPKTSSVYVTALSFSAAASTYTVSVAANPSDYGSVSASSVSSVASGTTLSTSTNTLSVGATNVTATAKSATAEYTYAFSNWKLSDGSSLPSTVTADLSVYANFTRSANSYTLAWSSNGGSDLAGSYTSGSTAYGADITAPNDPTLSNYTFDGWKTNNNGTGSTAGSTMPAANTTYYAAWKQTVTLKTGSQGSGSDKTPYVYLNGTALNSFSAHEADGYDLQGYYTAGSGGTKVLNADGTFAAANVTDYITSSKWSRTGAAPTLFAQWVATEDCHTLKYAWKITGKFCDDGSTSVTASDTVRFPANASNLYFTVSGTGNTVSKGSSYNLGNTQNNYFLLTAKTGYQIKSICFYGKVQDSSVDYTTDGSTWSSLSSTNTSGDDYYSFSSINASAFGIKLTAATPEGVWIRNMVIEICAAGGTTYNVAYDGNDETGGTAPTDATNYSYGDAVTVKGNTGSLEKTSYTFAGWTTNDDGTGSSYVADNTFSITANTTLYAKWTQNVTLDKNGGSTDGSATAVWNATGLTGITHAKPAAGYKLLGYYSASSDGTKVLNSDGSFAATNVTGYITSGKWSRTSATTLYAEYESAGALTWNLVVKSDTSALSTSTKTSAFTEIAVANMTNAALTGLTYTKSSKSSLTGKISTPASYDADKYVYVTFQVASGYKFTPSNISVKVQPVGENEHKAVELSLADASNNLVSSSATKCDGTSSGKTTTVTLAGDGTYFTGTVTLKIYVYAHATASATTYNCYRLGTPIEIQGEVEALCATMPSYTSMSYTTTSFLPDADASGSPITIVGGDNINTYQWKYNKVNDRTSGTNCGTGTSLTPLTDEDAATDGTRYYWCEMTNTSCGITIKSPAVAITVAAAKSDASVTWTNPESTPNYGGGGYTIKATVDQTGWDGNAADLVITAPAGINIYNVTSGTTSNQKWVQVNFDVQTSFDRTTYASNIPFTVSAAATATYNAISDDYNVSYSACAGAGEGSSYNIRMRKTVTKDGNYYHCANTDGWISPNISSSYSTAKAGTKMETDFDTVASSNTQYVWVRTYHANVNKVRIYADFRANDMTVSNVYKHTDYFTANNKYLVDYTAVYNGDEENENTGTAAQGYVDITLDEVMAANDILLVKFNDNKVRPLGAVITEGSAGSLNTYLQWSGDLEDDATVAKYTTDAYFTYSASKITENTNTLGAITYSSSNTSVATVDATGKVALVAAGSTTIKATLAASGCYKKAEISYTLNVTEVPCAIAAGTLTLTSGTETKCSSANVTLTLTGFESGASIQWKDGDTDIDNGGNYTIATDGTTSTLTTDQEGTYSVMVTKDCSVRSNRITISNKSTEVGAKRIVKNWYIKNGRPTPDIELWTLQNGAHLKSVAWSSTNTTGLADSDFYESDGKVYLKGKEPSSNTSGADIDYTLTLTVEDDCGTPTAMSASGQLIYLHHQQNTDKHVLAFVVNGTDKGGFTEGITAAQTTGVPLYNEIAANFDVLATNIRSTDDEQALKEYYSQFDILCVTDYPNTGDKGVNKKSYVDALGALVDIRPILTMEAWVSKLANWKAKGISGTPQSPTTRQYSMLLQCKDHEIFSGTKLTKIGEGDETMYRISMVCDTLEDYKTLDATYGSGTHESDKNYQYGKKPALQGFTFTKEMLDDELLPLGLIDDGSGNDLQVGIERQTEMEARLMVLGINSYAMERLTDDGQTVVVNALKYLMKKNSEDIADCSNTFVGGDDEEDVSTRYDWNVDSHWSGNAVPERTQKVRIVAPCVIKADEKFHVTGVVIAPSGKYNHGANTANGSLTIAAGGALIVDGKVEAATAPLYTETRATTPTDLILKTNSTAQSALIFDNEDGETQATVELYSLGRKESGSYYYQYMAVPMESLPVNPSFAGSGIYTYVWNEASGWERRGYYTDLYAFEGVGITTKFADAKTYEMKGTLASTETREIALTHNTNGQNMIGNSWTAPIQIADLEEDNSASEISQTVYIYSTGNGNTVSDGTTASAGQWLAIPFSAAGFEEWDGLKVIPAMQTFNINVTGTSTLTLDYDKVVRKRAAKMSVDTLTTPLHAPKRSAAHEGVELMRIRVEDSQTHTDLYLFKGERFSDEFDNGWEAEYLNGDGRSAKLYAQTEIGKMAVVATDELEGTVLGFEPGKETEYTFTFGGEGMGYYLNDLKLKKSTWINAGETYSFTYEEGDINRFIISTTPITTIMTGCESVGAEAAKVRKVIIDDKVYIIRVGHMYSVDGQMVK